LRKGREEVEKMLRKRRRGGGMRGVQESARTGLACYWSGDCVREPEGEIKIPRETSRGILVFVDMQQGPYPGQLLSLTVAIFTWRASDC
jgi:hypothetical protein